MCIYTMSDLDNLLENAPDDMATELRYLTKSPAVELSVFFDYYQRCQVFCQKHDADNLTEELWALAQSSRQFVAGWIFSNTHPHKRQKYEKVVVDFPDLPLVSRPSANELRVLSTIRRAEKLALSCVTRNSTLSFEKCKHRKSALEARVVKGCTAVLFKVGVYSSTYVETFGNSKSQTI